MMFENEYILLERAMNNISQLKRIINKDFEKKVDDIFKGMLNIYNKLLDKEENNE